MRVVVAGAAAAGIGAAVARRLVADGHEVAGLATCAATDDWPPGLISQHVVGPASETLPDVIRSGLFDDVDAVVWGESIFALEDPEDFDHGAWTESFRANVVVPNTVFRETWRRVAPGAAYVFVTSTEGFVGSFGATAYAAARAATHNLVQSWANLAGERAVRVNALAPGWIGGVMGTDDVFAASRSITPLGRLGDPAEVAAVAAFLIGPDASFVNGTVVTVDGGYRGVDPVAKLEFEAFLATRG